MPQFISTNVTAIIARNNLDSSSNSLAISIERLSSGQRINSSKDDAAGMAIASRMTSQIKGMEMAQRNTQDAISMTQTTEGALGTQVSQLQRIRELAVQASNGILGESDRKKLDNEAQALLDEIDRIATSSSFNGNLLLSHKNKIDNNAITKVDQNEFLETTNSLIGLSITTPTLPMEAVINGSDIELDTTGITHADIGTVFEVTANAYTGAGTPIVGGGSQLITGNQDWPIDADSNIETADAKESGRFQMMPGSFTGDLNEGDFEFTSGDGTAVAKMTFNGAVAGTDESEFDVVDTKNGNIIRIKAKMESTGVRYYHTGALATSTPVSMTRTYQVQSTGDRTIEGHNTFEIVDTTHPNMLNFQVGADNGQNRTVKFKSTTTVDMGLIDSAQTGMVRVSLLDTDKAMATIDRMDAALKYINDERSNMGAYQNRLTQTISNLNAGIENTSASKSRISDTDFAKETANMTKNQILHQAGVAMLKQANSLPESVLSLLG